MRATSCAEPAIRSRWLEALSWVTVAVVLSGIAAVRADGAPDRAYELVTALPKTELFVGASGWSGQTTAAGDDLLMNGFGALGDPPELFASHPYRATRTPMGWASESALPVGADVSKPSGTQLSFFTDQFDYLFTTTHPWDPGDIDGSGAQGGWDLYVQRNGMQQPLWATGGPVNRDQVNTLIRAITASDDLRHVLIASAMPLLPEDMARTGVTGLYEWFDGDLRLVAVDDAGALLSTDEIRAGSTSTSYNAMSSNGRTIAFTVASGGLYVRVDGEHTVPVPSAGANSSSLYAGMSRDGRMVYFQSPEQLTDDDQDPYSDLYAYDVFDDVVTRLSAHADASVAALPSGVAVSSDDGSMVYFVAGGGLVSGSGTSAQQSLYLWDSGDLRFVTSIGEAFASLASQCNKLRITSDGRHLLFSTYAPIADGDTDANGDLYLYDADSDELRRVSKGPDGGNGPFDPDIGRVSVNCTDEPGNGFQKPTRPLTENGQQVFFETNEGLVARDENGAADVYAYDWQTDQTTLISQGTSANDSLYLDSSADGRDVFFVTSDRLVPEDGDYSHDFYDARVGGGFPAVPERQACTGSECRGAPTAPPTLPPVATATAAEPSGRAQTERGRLLVDAITKAQRRRFAQSGRLKIRVTVPAQGRLQARATARVRGILATVARTSRQLPASGEATLSMRLSRAARVHLRKHRRLRVRISVQHSGAAAGVSASVTLTLPKSTKRHAGRSK